MNLKDQETALIEKWLNDPSFVNWAKGLDAKDSAKWENYFNLYPEHWELGKTAKALVLGLPFHSIPTDPGKSKKALSVLLHKLELTQNSQRKSARIRHMMRAPLLQAVAAVALLVMACGFIYFQYLRNPQVVIATNYGQQLEHLLPDGSLVTLNANSTLKYHSRKPRTVWLEGEAFFEIVKKPDTREKFNVWTADLEVTVLGTSFNVNTRNEQTQVFLQEGKVKLELEAMTSQSIEMEPGDLIAYSKKHQQLSEKKKNASLLENASWKEGSLIFKDTPLPEALSAIEVIYGINFITAPGDLDQKLISGGVPIRNLEVTLVTLSEVYGIQIRKEGSYYYLQGDTE